MPVDADLIRRLVVNTETSWLDYKKAAYGFDERATKDKAQVEFSKDIMAMANTLGPLAQGAYILIGVEEDAADKTGRIIGVPPESHPDDGNLHTIVKNYLNATPTFSYQVVEVDGLSVGVVEIKPGARPFYPIKTCGVLPGSIGNTLQKDVAMYRNGPTTQVASPDLINRWAREDDELSTETLLLERELHLAHLTVNVDLQLASRSAFWFNLNLTNNGTLVAKLVRTEANVRLAKSYLVALGKPQFYGTPDYVVPLAKKPHATRHTLRPGESAAIEVYADRSKAMDLVSKFGNVELLDGHLEIEVVATCEGPTGRIRAVKAEFSPS
jgi:Putative DNA-binding domain